MPRRKRSSKSESLPWSKLIIAVAALIFVWTGSSYFRDGSDSYSVLYVPGSDELHMKNNFVNVDMHVHSTESDGDRTPEAQIRLAQLRGMKNIWLTDHDMIRDLHRIREIQKYAEQEDIQVGFGVEITVSWLKKEHHLLGYFPDSLWASPVLSAPMIELQKACAQVKASREKRNQDMVSFLNQVLSDNPLYFDSPEQAAQFQPMTVKQVGDWSLVNAGLTELATLGRPHFNQFLQKVYGVRSDVIFGPRDGDGIGLISSENGNIYFGPDRQGKAGTEVEALMHSKTLGKRNIAFLPLPIEDGIRMIHAAGGRSVIAHIPTLGPKWEGKFKDDLPKLKELGLWGIEAFSSEISEINHEKLHKICADLGLAETGGSDNHGTLKPYAKLGRLHRDLRRLAKDGVKVELVGEQHWYDEINNWARSGGLQQASNMQKAIP